MQATATHRKPRPDTYSKVFDSRKRRIRGLWKRNDRFFANITIQDELGRKTSRMVPLQGSTLDAAKDDLRRLLVERNDDRVRPIGLSPTLADFKEVFLKELAVSGKRASTISKESYYLKDWALQIGHMRLNKIRANHLAQVLTKLAASGYSPRSVNLYLLAIRSLFKAALRDGHVKPPLPFEGLTWMRVDTKSRDLFTAEDIDRLCSVSPHASKNGRQFTDYIRFLQYSGARRDEALRIRWSDVDLKRGHVTIGAEGDSKNREARHVDLNPNLNQQLQDMLARRQPDSVWLFPSPQRGDSDSHTKTFKESLRLTLKASGYSCRECGFENTAPSPEMCPQCGSKRIERHDPLLTGKFQSFGFHDLRHHFISYAVMSGVDFMTIARWAGHKDGGILIGKVYGHLADEHRKLQASRLVFGPTAVPEPGTPTQSPAPATPPEDNASTT